MSRRILRSGDILAISFPQHLPSGREQEGYRPALMVASPEQMPGQRYPVAIVIPLTTDRQQTWANHAPDLYLRFPLGTGGLRSPSILLLDQIRSVDVTRIRNYLGSLEPETYAIVLQSLQYILNP